MAALALLSLAFLGLYAHRAAARQVREEVRTENRSASANAAEMVRIDFANCVGMASALARMPDVAEGVTTRDEEGLRARLAPLVASYPDVDRIFIVDSGGILVSDYPPVPAARGWNLSDQDWFRGATRSAEPYVSEVHRRRVEPGDLVMTVAVPALGGADEIVGVLAMQHRLTALSDWLRDIRVGADGFVFLLDQNGIVAAHPRLNLRDLETLLHVVTHDLKEPLRTIEGFSGILEERYALSLDAKGRDFIRRVIRGAARLRELLDDLLLLSRARQAAPSAEAVDGGEATREVPARLDGMIHETRGEVFVAEDLPRVRAERVWVTEALYNLVHNSLKFHRAGEPPRVEIVPYVPLPGEPAGVGFEVRDRGPGVAREFSERIFRLFQRGVGRDVEGSGAGLAIVRQIAERCGGSAWVRAREGGGSEFIVTFGRAKEEANEATGVPVSAHAGDAGRELEA